MDCGLPADGDEVILSLPIASVILSNCFRFNLPGTGFSEVLFSMWMRELFADCMMEAIRELLYAFCI